jgi:hypothetical protein
LADRFRLLSGSRRGLERHQTLRHTAGWSYDLLVGDDAAVLRDCSVFAGGFDLAAVAYMCGSLDEYFVLAFSSRWCASPWSRPSEPTARPAFAPTRSRFVHQIVTRVTRACCVAPIIAPGSGFADTRSNEQAIRPQDATG